MTTDKERAEVMRELAAESGGNWTKKELANRADALDPPTYADGQWVTDSRTQIVYQWSESDGCWWQGGDEFSMTNVNDVHDPKPLRVLAGDEIAVGRFEVNHMGPNDTTAKFMREAADRADALNHGSNVTHTVRQVLRGYADALDAAAGVAK